MSVQAAIEFFQTVRLRPDLHDRIRAWGPAPSTTQLVELASDLGLSCSEAELQAAYRHDWVMRWVRHAGS